MKAIVIRPYNRPYENPIAIRAHELVMPDFERPTDIAGWVWCAAADGRSGWTPRSWLEHANDGWRITRDFSALELTVAPGESLDVRFEESGFYWVVKESGEEGWVPAECVSLDQT